MEEKPKDEAGQKNDSCDFCGGPHDPGLCPEPKEEYWLITSIHAYGLAIEGHCDAVRGHPVDWIINNRGLGKTMMYALQISQKQFKRLNQPAAESKTHARA